MKLRAKASDILAAIEPKIAKVVLDIEAAEKRMLELQRYKESDPEKKKAYGVIEERTRMANHIKSGLAKLDRQLRSLPMADVELSEAEASLLGYVDIS